MAVVTGVTLKILINEHDVTGYFRSLSLSGDRGMYDTTVFGSTAKTVIPGLNSGTIDVGGLFESVATVSAPDNVFTAIESASTPPIVSVFPEGWTLGNRAYLLQAHESNHDIGAQVDDLIMNSASFTTNDGFDFGVSLHALSAETSFPVTGTAVNNGAASANGGVGFLHVTAIAGGAPNIVFKVQHSVDGSTSWADLVLFTAVTAAGAQRVVVAAGTTVRQYLRMTATEGGTTTSVTGNVSFARR